MSFLHGTEVIEIDQGIESIREVGAGALGICGFKGADCEAAAGLYLVTNEKEAQKFGTDNFIARAIKNIYKQSGAKILISIVDAVLTKDGEIDLPKSKTALIGTAGDTYTGIKALLSASSRFGVQPKILISELSEDKNTAEALLQVAQKLRGICVIDAPDTFEAAINYATKQIVSPRAYIVWPKVINAGVEQALSPFIAGAIVQNDLKQGYWTSPSNKRLFGIDQLKYPVDFTLGEPDCRANILNANHITTVINEKGFRSWGNHTSSDTEKWRFLSTRRIADMINDSIQNAHLWAIDKNIGKAYISTIEESVNAFIRDLQAKGALINGLCVVNKELTTPSAIMQGHITFDVEFTSPYPAERITFRSILTDKYLKEVF